MLSFCLIFFKLCVFLFVCVAMLDMHVVILVLLTFLSDLLFWSGTCWIRDIWAVIRSISVVAFVCSSRWCYIWSSSLTECLLHVAPTLFSLQAPVCECLHDTWYFACLNHASFSLVPQPPTITLQSPKDYIFDPRENIVIHCEAKGKPHPR